jgi:UDP-N-acetyl-D-glucosamine dehydrogenase
MNDVARDLLARIESGQACVAVIGLGYVGLPVAHACLKAGFRVIGFDIDARKVEGLRSGTPYIQHLGQDFFDFLRSSPAFSCTTDPAGLVAADAILLCVPTPLGSHKEPDLGFVLDSTRMVAKVLRKGLPGHHARGNGPDPRLLRVGAQLGLLPGIQPRAGGSR